MQFFLHEQQYRNLGAVSDKLVTFCGTGALGANCAENLARMGFTALRLIDRDRIEAHNLSTQPWSRQDIGAPKAKTLAQALYRAVGCRAEAQVSELSAGNATKLLAASAVVVDAFDNMPSRRAVASAAAALGIPCLHIALGVEGNYGCGLWDAAYTLADPPSAGLDGCDYPLTRPLAQLVAAAAAEVLARHLLNGERKGFEITLGDLNMRG